VGGAAVKFAQLVSRGGIDRRYDHGYTTSMKTAVSIPDKVFRVADRLAKRLHVSRSRLYAAALADFVARHESKRITERLDAVYGDEDSSLDPALGRIQSNSLPPEW